MKKIVSITLVAVLSLFLFSCKGEKKQKFTEYYFDWFDTVTVVTGYESSEEEFKKVTAKIEELLGKYHRLYNIYQKYDGINNIASINRLASSENLRVETEIIELLKFSKELCLLTDEKFNIAMGSVLEIWHKYREQGMKNPGSAELPDIDELESAARHTDIDKIIIDEKSSTVRLADDRLSIDVGAVAKGYACEQAAKMLQELGKSGYIINAGGNVRAVGLKPNGEKWLVGIENPSTENQTEPYIAYLMLTDESLVTSGSYQRYYTVEGKNYHHIIDPETLFPSERYMSVSVISPHSGMGDGLSTALFNMDFEEGFALVSSLPDVEAMWVMPDGKQLYSNGFAKYTAEK